MQRSLDNGMMQTVSKSTHLGEHEAVLPDLEVRETGQDRLRVGFEDDEVLVGGSEDRKGGGRGAESQWMSDMAPPTAP